MEVQQTPILKVGMGMEGLLSSVDESSLKVTEEQGQLQEEVSCCRWFSRWGCVQYGASWPAEEFSSVAGLI